MLFSTLPVELLDAVCGCVPRSDLLALSQTCRSLHAVAQRLLYQHLALSPFHHNLDALRTLAHRPDVACFVRTISVTLDTSWPVSHSFHDLLATALSHMQSLRSLDMSISLHASWVLTSSVDPSITYPLLQRFACSLTLDTHVAHFLSKTPALRELELNTPSIFHPSVPATALPSTSIPHLRQFIGSSEIAKLVVPGRPLESVYLHSGELVEEDIRYLANGTARVRILGATTRSHPSPLLDLLDLLARHLPHIVYLRIMTTHTFPTAPDVAFYDQVANRLAALSDLLAFELSGMHWGSCTIARSGDKRFWQSHPPANILSDQATWDADTVLPY